MSKQAYTGKEIESFIEQGEISLPITVKLSSPIPFGDDTYSELTFKKEPTAGDLAEMPVSGQVLGDTFRIVSSMTGVETPVIKKMTMKDFTTCQNVVQNFL